MYFRDWWNWNDMVQLLLFFAWFLLRYEKLEADLSVATINQNLSYTYLLYYTEAVTRFCCPLPQLCAQAIRGVFEKQRDWVYKGFVLFD